MRKLTLKQIESLSDEQVDILLAIKIMEYELRKDSSYYSLYKNEEDTRYIIGWDKMWSCEENELYEWMPHWDLNHVKLCIERITPNLELAQKFGRHVIDKFHCGKLGFSGSDLFYTFSITDDSVAYMFSNTKARTYCNFILEVIGITEEDAKKYE